MGARPAAMAAPFAALLLTIGCAAHADVTAQRAAATPPTRVRLAASTPPVADNSRPSPVPELVPMVPGAFAIAPGYEHLCVIKSGSVLCLGRNQHGQLGNGTTQDATNLVPTGITDAVDLAAGPLATCAIRTDRTVWCWGYDSTTTRSETSAPWPIEGVARARHIAMGGAGTCVVTFEATVQCWGEDALVEGAGHDPTRIAIPAEVSRVAVGPRHACGLATNGSTWCWGANDRGQIGDGTIGGIRTPVRVAGIAGAIGIAAGGVHGSSCAVLVDATVHCWGEDTDGQLGDGDETIDRSTPARATGVIGAVSVSVGAFHACATAVDGAAWCWGRSAYVGSVTPGDDLVPAGPVRVNGTEGATMLRSQGTSSSAMFSDHTAKCWGTNDAGQLGNGAPSGVTGLVGVVGMG